MDRKLKHRFYNVLSIVYFLGLVLPVLYTVLFVFFSKDIVEISRGLFRTKLLFLLLKSVGIATLIALLSTFFGSLLAFLIIKTKIKFRSFFKIVLLIPLFVSPYLLAVAWKDIVQFIFHSNSLLYSISGVILILTTIYTPLSMLIVSSGLSQIDSQIEEAGILSVGFNKMVFRILIPLLKPTFQLSLILVFIFSLSEFSVPAFFGVKVFTTEIFTEFSAFYHHTLAVLQSLFLVILSLLLVYSQRKQLADNPFFSIKGKGVKLKYYTVKGFENTTWLFPATWFFVSVIFPILMLVYQTRENFSASFNKAWQLLQPSIFSSLTLASISALCIVIIGAIVAFHLNNRNHNRLFYWWLIVTFVMPSTVYGISLIKFYNQPSLELIYGSSLILIIGYIGKFSFVSVKLIDNAFKQLPKSLFEIAKIQGVSFFRRLTQLYFPLLFPALFTGFMVSFVFSLSELGTSIMLYPPGTSLMPIKVFTVMANAPQALNSAMTLVVLLVTLVSTLSFYILAKPYLKRFSYD